MQIHEENCHTTATWQTSAANEVTGGKFEESLQLSLQGTVQARTGTALTAGTQSRMQHPPLSSSPEDSQSSLCLALERPSGITWDTRDSNQA